MALNVSSLTLHSMDDSSDALPSGTINHIQKLPEEILTECLQHLPITVAKIARLVRHQWSNIISRWLFRRVYFMPQTEFMEIFEAITSNPLFALGISELVYDACQFMPMWSLPESEENYYYEDICPDEDVVVGEAEWPLFITESRKKHSQLQLDQQRILDEQSDYRILCAGLQRLPNLIHISILEIDHRSAKHLNEFPWYSSMAAKFRKFVYSPAPFYDFEGTDQGHTWNPRAIESLMKAISMRNARLTHFHCKTMVPLTLWFAKSPLTWFPSLFRSLNCLKFHCWRGEERPEALADSEETRPYLTAFAEGVKDAQDLHHLSLTMDYLTSNDWDNMFSGALWPKLTSLHLSHICLHSDSLVSLCHNHRHTLRELSLAYIYLQASDTLRSWEDVSKEFGSSLRLNYIRLDCLELEKSGGNAHRTWSLSHLLLEIMQWVPNQTLEQGPDDRITKFMWYPTSYTPRLINGSYYPNNSGCRVWLL